MQDFWHVLLNLDLRVALEKTFLKNYNLERILKKFMEKDELRKVNRKLAKLREGRASRLGLNAGISEVIAKKRTDMIAIIKESEDVQNNAEFLADPKRREEYEVSVKLIRSNGYTDRIPSFEECISAINRKGDNMLTALRRKTKEPRLVIVPHRDENNKIKFFKSGLVEAHLEPEHLRASNNHHNFVGQHYDAISQEFDQLGLRFLDFEEYKVLFELVRLLNNKSIDIKTITLLRNKGAKSKNLLGFASPKNSKNPRKLEYGIHTSFLTLVSRPSLWGEDLYV